MATAPITMQHITGERTVWDSNSGEALLQPRAPRDAQLRGPERWEAAELGGRKEAREKKAIIGEQHAPKVLAVPHGATVPRACLGLPFDRVFARV